MRRPGIAAGPGAGGLTLSQPDRQVPPGAVARGGAHRRFNSPAGASPAGVTAGLLASLVLSLLFFAGGGATEPAEAQTSVELVGNNLETDAGTVYGWTNDLAQAFTTGSGRNKLTSVQLGVNAGGTVSAYSAKIVSAGAAGPGSTTVGTLTKPASLSAGISNEFTGSVDLEPNTTYYFLLDLTASDNTITLKSTASDDENSGAAAGWSIADVVYSRNIDNSGTWSSNTDTLKIIVNGYQVLPDTFTMASNIGQTTNNQNLYDKDFRSAFTTGGNPAGYGLTGVTLKLGSIANSTVTFAVTVEDSNWNILATLDHPASLANGNNTFTVPAADGGKIDLLPNRTYRVRVEVTAQGNSQGRIALTTAGDENAGKWPGWSIANTGVERTWSESTGNWTTENRVLQMALQGYAPDPPYPVSGEINDAGIFLHFDQALDADAHTSRQRFRIKADGVDQGVAPAVSISGNMLRLGLTGAYAGSKVTVSYTRDASDPLRGRYADVSSFSDFVVTNRGQSHNLGNNTGESAASTPAFTRDRAQAFTTASNPGGYTLTSVQFKVLGVGSPTAYLGFTHFKPHKRGNPPFGGTGWQ